MNAAEVARMPVTEWRRLLAAGHAIDPLALAGGSYLGRSLGLPRIVERLTWTWFRKELVADEVGRVHGWNVRVEQDGAHRPRMRGGVPWTFGHYEVTPLRPSECPLPVGDGVLLDYGQGANPAADPTRLVRDPLVALEAGSTDLLLGWTYVRVLGRSLGTPSWFVLQRDGVVEHVPPICHERSPKPPR